MQTRLADHASAIRLLSYPRSRRWRYGERIEVGSPGVIGGGFVAPFAVQTVNGAQKLAVAPEMLPDSGIDTRAMRAGATEADTIVDSGDVIDTATNWNNSGVGKSIFNTVNIPITAGSLVYIDFTCDGFTFPDGSVGAGTLSILIYAAGTLLRTCVVPSVQGVGLVGARTVIATGGSTSFDVKLVFTNTSGNRINIVTPKLTIREVKRSQVTTLSGATPTPSISYRTSLYGGTSGTFLGADIGTADDWRVVVFAVGWTANEGSIPSATVNGANAPRYTGQHTGITGWAFFAVRVPTGTTADIVVTIPNSDGSLNGITISIWKVVAFDAVPKLTNYSWSDSLSGTGIGVSSVHIGQVLVAFAYSTPGVTNFVGSWPGTDTLTERVDATNAVSRRYAGYDMTLTQNLGFESLTISNSGSASPQYLFGVMTFQ